MKSPKKLIVGSVRQIAESTEENNCIDNSIIIKGKEPVTYDPEVEYLDLDNERSPIIIVPGVMGSRLFNKDWEQVWEPFLKLHYHEESIDNWRPSTYRKLILMNFPLIMSSW